MEGHSIEMSLGIPPAAVEESADKVTVVLAAVTEGPGGTQAGSVDEVVEMEPVVAVRVAAESLVWGPDSWTVIQQELVKSVVGFDLGQSAVGHRATGPTGKKELGNKKAETVGVPVSVGACAAADRAALPVCEGQMLKGVAALGKVPALQAVLAGAGSRGFVVSEDLGQLGHNTVSGSVSYNLLVPAVRKFPSVRKACFPCLQRYVLAFPLDIFGVPKSHNPGQGNQTPVGYL